MIWNIEPTTFSCGVEGQSIRISSISNVFKGDQLHGRVPQCQMQLIGNDWKYTRLISGANPRDTRPESNIGLGRLQKVDTSVSFLTHMN